MNICSTLRPGTYGFADVQINDTINAGQITVNSELIDRFAEFSGDHFSIHMDKAAAAKQGFPARVAHGLLIISLVDGLKNHAPAQFKAQASLEWNWKFKSPVLAGDTLNVSITVTDKLTISDPSRGILVLNFDVFNQHEKRVQIGTNLLMVHV